MVTSKRIRCVSRGEFYKGQYIKKGESIAVPDDQVASYLASPGWVLARSIPTPKPVTPEKNNEKEKDKKRKKEGSK